MRKVYLLLLVALCLNLAAQIPNSGFENWTTTTYTLPVGWRMFGKISQATPANGGNYAIKIERNPLKLDEPGAIVYGNPEGNIFTGGIPFADRPDSLITHLKYDLPVNDSAWVLFFFKKNGSFISQDLYYLKGSNPGSFARKAYAVNYSSGVTPDSLIIGFTSTNPDNPVNGGYVIVDDVYFKNTTEVIPNGDFENWNTINEESINSWFSSNQPANTFTLQPVTKTTDKYSGNFAVRIENLPTPGGLQEGYIIAGPQGNNGPAPGFSVNARYSGLNGYYKFAPQNSDTLNIGVMMFSNSNPVGWGLFSTKNAANNYAYFDIPINYDGMFTGIPDSATVYALPFVGGSYPHGNSVAIIDELNFDAPISTSIQQLSISDASLFLYPNPANNYVYVNYILPTESDVTISVYSVEGKLIYKTNKSNEAQGAHIFTQDITNLADGVYSIKISSKDFEQSKRFSVVK